MSPAGSKRKLISIITPCYNEADNVEDCCAAIRNLFAGELNAYDHEHIFCDNASTDATPEILRKLAAADKHVKVILNARNFGPSRSDFNGLMNASGDAVVVFLPADQQDPPEVIPEMVRRWEAGSEVVYGIRANREEGLTMRTTRRLYYRLVDEMARPFMKAWVFVLHYSTHAVTGLDGHYEIQGIPVGEVEVSALLPDASMKHVSQRMQLNPGDNTLDITIEFDAKKDVPKAAP